MPESAALPTEQPAGMGGWDRRAVVRYPSSSRAVCSHPHIPDEERVWPARLRDIAAHGVGLLLDRGFAPGPVLQVTLLDPAKNLSRAVLVMVMHGRRQKEGNWLIGCAFTDELTDKELKALL